VVGVPDTRFGEAVVALVVPRDGTHPHLDTDLAAWCRDRVAGYKRPKRFFLVGSLERSAAGKANYPRLRERAAALSAAATSA